MGENNEGGGSQPMTRRRFLEAAAGTVAAGAQTPTAVADISPAVWPNGEYERFLSTQNVDRTKADVATGTNGAVTVAYNGIAARAGLEALAKGGNAIDAAMTAAVTRGPPAGTGCEGHRALSNRS